MCTKKYHKDDDGDSLNNVYQMKQGKYLYIIILSIKIEKQKKLLKFFCLLVHIFKVLNYVIHC